MFAFIPIIFSIQQFTEGIVWLSLDDPVYKEWQSITTLFFVFVAQVLWPIWVPLSIYLFEENNSRKKWIMRFVILGVLLGLFHGYNLIMYNVSALITPKHIHYDFTLQANYPVLIAVSYFLCTVTPPFISSGKRMTTLGFLNLFSALVAIIFFQDNIISVWCFFSALISWEVYLILKESDDSNKIIPLKF